MKHVMVRYKVKAERAAENEAFITAVFEQLQREKPAGIRYASYKQSDGVSFVHIASIDAAPDGGNPLAALAAFKAFTAQIKERCEEPQAPMDLTEIGSYPMFGN